MEVGEVDAPQISTLREETSPAPTRRVKLLVKNAGGPTATQTTTTSRKRPISALTDEEDEEDQLIDDDEAPVITSPPIQPPPPANTTTISTSGEPPTKRKAPNKRKPRKTEKKVAEEERIAAEKIMGQTAGNLAPSMTWFEVSPHRAHEHAGQMSTIDLSKNNPNASNSSTPVIPPPPLSIVPLTNPSPSVSVSATPSKKEKAPRKTVTRPRAKPGPKPKAILLPQPEDNADVASEAGYTGTAASSPVTAHFEGNSPEPEGLPPPVNGLVVEDVPINLHEVPLPQYPLPLKPFPVQPPQKINTSAPQTVTLDRSGAKVRNWRVVNREIRGIAGGRWFTKTWIGGKDSPFADHVEKQASVVLPKVPTISSGTSKPGPKPKALKNTSAVAAGPSLNPSRSSSAVPSRMQTVAVAPPSDGGDSDVVMLA
ncbi:hypothetical protein MIND_00530600 [Mycena indigotica]|uniref:Uncharacterized protein n=1 Tax=Mycena indigotica TaxID=2126181 RepID=A0A8H6SY90_9AGAR|nr:uncharacterized protein MIND_00530600 [Mycena indigotica]KAF7307365.1 hypothetical protein MIND_00530600 [Mycena indigotica]